MTDDQLDSLTNIGASLRHIGAAMTESFNHARRDGSKTPLQPLDHALSEEIPNLRRVRRAGEAQLADALVAFRATFGGADNG